MDLKEQIGNIKHLVTCPCSFYVSYWAFLKYSLCDSRCVEAI